MQKFLSRRLLYAGLAVVLALAVRIPFWHFGGLDDQWWQIWGETAQQHGIASPFLLSGSHLPANYPPLFPYLLWIMGWVQHWTAGFIQITTQVHWVATLADLGVAWTLYQLVLPNYGERKAWIAVSAWLLNPFVIYESALWGQNDVLITLWTVLTLLMLERKKPIAAAVMVGLGLLTKAQFMIVVPLIMVWVLACKLWSLRDWLRAAAAWVLTICAGLLPLALYGAVQPMLQNAYFGAAGYYPYLSLNAYNFWWLQMPNIYQYWVDTNVVWMGLTQMQLGVLMFAACYVAVISMIVAKARQTSVVQLGAYLAIGIFAFFCLTTQMHERYSYPAYGLLLLGAIAAQGARRSAWRWSAYWVLALAGTLNLSMVWSPGPLRFSVLQVGTIVAYLNLAFLALLMLEQLWALVIRKHPTHE